MHTTTGTLGAIWRYPVKSMLGEPLEWAEVTPRGVQGDRVYAVLDPLSGRVLSAKREATLSNAMRGGTSQTGWRT